MVFYEYVKDGIYHSGYMTLSREEFNKLLYSK